MRRSLAVLFALFVISSCGRKENAAESLARGNEYLKARNYPEAILSFKKAIRANASFGEAYWGLGNAQVQSGNLFDGYSNLSRAADLLPARADIKADLGGAMLTLFLSEPSRPAALRDRLVKISDQLLVADAGSPPALRLKAYLALTEKKPQEAIALLERALARDPKQLEALFPLIQAHWMAGQPNQAEQRARQAIELAPGFQPAYDAMIFAAAAPPRNLPLLESFLKLKVANIPNSAEAVIGLASFYRNQDKQPELRATLELLKDTQRYPEGWIRLGEYYTNFGQLPEAEQALRQAASLPAIKAKGEVALAKFLFFGNKEAEGLQLIDQYLKEMPGDVAAMVDRAAMVIQKGDSARYPAIQKELGAIAPGDPNYAQALYQLGRLHHGQGNLAEAQRTFEALLKVEAGSLQARSFLADIHVNRGEYAKALQYADELLIGAPGNPRVRLLRAKCLRGAGRQADARGELLALLRDQPGFGAALLELAYLESAQERPKEAESVFQQVLKGTPNDLSALAGLADVLIAQGKEKQALELLNRQRGKLPAVPLELTISAMAMRIRQYPLAVQSFRSIPEAELPAVSLSQYAEALLQTGGKQEAVRLARAAVAKAPQDPERAVFAGYVLESVGQSGEAKAMYEAALKLQPSHLGAGNNLAYLLASESQSLDRARALAEGCVKAKPEDPGYLDTLGLVYLRQGQKAQAVDALQRSVRLNPRVGLHQLHLAQALRAAGDPEKSKKAAQSALQLGLEPAARTEAEQLSR
jgi:tetratricopeptide (TPR) repeat protein